MKDVIKIDNLTKNYGKHRGVNDISFAVHEGDIFGFLGPNGAGKSTTIRSMLGLIAYDEGSITILGKDSVKEREEILKNVGYMPSECWFHQGMRVKDVLKLSADLRKMDCKEEAGMLCERLKLDQTRKVSDLSLGNRKKVSIVCAMQHKPKLFIFDEPTSGLDPLMQRAFFNLIKEYVAKGASCMLSTHVLYEISKHCNRVAVMNEGKLLCTDYVENILKGAPEASVEDVFMRFYED